MRYVEMCDVKNMHSDPENAQMAIFRLSSPVVLSCPPAWWMSAWLAEVMTSAVAKASISGAGSSRESGLSCRWGARGAGRDRPRPACRSVVILERRRDPVVQRQHPAERADQHDADAR